MNRSRWAALCVFSAVSSAALGVTVTVVPQQAVVTAGSQSSFEVRISGLGNQAPPSLGAYEMGVTYDPAVLSVNPTNVTFTTQLNPSVQPPPTTSNGTLSLAQVSLASPEVLNSSQPGSFTLATVPFTAPQVGTSKLDPTGVVLGDATGNQLTDVTSQPATVRVELASPTSPLLTPEGDQLNAVLSHACGALQGLPSGQLTPGQRALLQTCHDVSDLPEDQRVIRLDAAVPRVVKPAAQYGLGATQNQLHNLFVRLAQIRGGAVGFDIAGSSLQINGQRIDGTQLAALLGQLTGGGASADSNTLGGRLGVFVNGKLGNGNRDTTQREAGFDFSVYSITAGVDYRFTDQLVLGVALGYGNTNSDFDQSPNKATVDGWSGMVYGTYSPTEALYVDGILSGGKSNYDVRRLDPFSGLTATGNTDGTSFGASLGAGYDLNRQQWTFGPYARVSYVKVKVDGYQESPVAGNAYRFQSQDATSTTLALGGRASYAISTRYGVVLPQAWLDWTHEFSNDSQIITAQLVNDPTNTPINLLTDNPDRNFFHAGIGVSMQFAHGRSAYLLYERLFGHSYLGEGTLQVGIRLEF